MSRDRRCTCPLVWAALITLPTGVHAEVAPAPVAAPATPTAAGATAVALSRCQAIVTTVDRSKLPAASPKLKLSKPTRCFATPGATYSLLPASYTQPDPKNPDYFTLVWQLAQINPDGAATPFSPIPVSAAAVPSAAQRGVHKRHGALRFLTDVQTPGDDSAIPYIERIVDLNGDGNPEVFIVTSYDRYEVAAEKLLEIWSIRKRGPGSELVPYPVDPGLPPITEAQLQGRSLVVDADGDGLPDLRTDGPYHRVQQRLAGADEDVPAVPAWFLLHATAEGRYVGNDAVAKAELARSCPSMPNLQLPYAKSRNFLQEVVCLRAFGKSEQQVLRDLAPHCKAIAKEDETTKRTKSGCPSWLLEAAAVPPPISLP